MNFNTDKTQENTSRAVANDVGAKSTNSEAAFYPMPVGFEDNRPESVSQRKMQKLVSNSPQTMQLEGFHQTVNTFPPTKRVTQLEEITGERSAYGADGVYFLDTGKVVKFPKDGRMDKLLNDLGAVFGLEVPGMDRVAKLDSSHAQLIEDMRGMIIGENEKVATAKEQNPEDDLLQERNETDIEAIGDIIIMDKVVGTDLSQFDTRAAIRESHRADGGKLNVKGSKFYHDMGRLIVMDLLIRNNDRFNLRDLTDGETDNILEFEGDWQGLENTGNIMIDGSGNIVPIDTQYTPAEDEDGYADTVATILLTRQDQLVASIVSMMDASVEDNIADIQIAIKGGISGGIVVIMSM